MFLAAAATATHSFVLAIHHSFHLLTCLSNLYSTTCCVGSLFPWYDYFMRVLITGSRDWEDASVIEEALEMFDAEDTVLVSGHCPTGADFIAEQYAYRNGWDVELHEADWDKFGKFAGPKRNQEMVDSGVDVVLAFVKDDSRGAGGTVRYALQFDNWVRVLYFSSRNSSSKFVEHNLPHEPKHEDTLF